ncbi:MAG: cobalt-precorrin-6A reductase [Rhizobiaceae bacterium]|nr:cobalt-precorrin-6A reductase [Rhizobiaceae bacterium]
MGKTRILILGGTTEARSLAGALASRPELDVLLSLAGRTADPAEQPVPGRVGGFGGAEGLSRYLRDEAFDLLVDATHPFAARISANAAEAIKAAGIPALALRRPAWIAVEGDRWISVRSIAEAIKELGSSPLRVFLAIGRQEAHHADAAPIHHYLVRSVDPVDPPLDAAGVTYLHTRGPFRLEDEMALLRQHRIDVIVTKNSGGSATHAKIEAARALDIRVIMVERATVADMPAVETVEAALAEIDHLVSSLMKRGV